MHIQPLKNIRNQNIKLDFSFRAFLSIDQNFLFILLKELNLFYSLQLFFKNTLLQIIILHYILLKYYLCVWGEKKVMGKNSIFGVRKKNIKYK